MTDLDPWTTVTADGGDQKAEDQDPRMSEVDFSHPRESGQHCFTSYWLENGKHPSASFPRLLSYRAGWRRASLLSTYCAYQPSVAAGSYNIVQYLRKSLICLFKLIKRTADAAFLF